MGEGTALLLCYYNRREQKGMTLTPEQHYQNLFEQMYSICEQQGWGDPFSYARSREIHMAGVLGHTIAEDYSGADAYDEAGGCEYKSTINKTIRATYNGISVQPTWEQQLKYLVQDKLGKYAHHYYARYVGGTIAEVWMLTAEQVLDILLPKLQRDWERKVNSTRHADPRLSGMVTAKEIRTYGQRLV